MWISFIIKYGRLYGEFRTRGGKATATEERGAEAPAHRTCPGRRHCSYAMIVHRAVPD
jgi:hypothetical protein